MATATTSSKGVVLVTGGAGYIGSHTIFCLLEQGYGVVVLDNLSNSSVASLDRVAELTGLDEAARRERLVFHQVDLCDRDALKRVFETSPRFAACIHFAGLKASATGTGATEQPYAINTVRSPSLLVPSCSHEPDFSCVDHRPWENRRESH